ncbi:hypothetical protein R3P38DRAFT_2835136 [Favolaschia claudopus]|uniref:Protein kinase domain-containing protein n=1 Tax=Favolaschia claudopus TaxID=2862362 RepID=A0AAW0EF49_9AGAR
MPRSSKRPDIETVYHPGAEFSLFLPERLPDTPVQHIAPPGATPRWPKLHLDPALKKQLHKKPLDACYERDITYRTHLVATSIKLEEGLSTGFREEQAAQVWRVSLSNSSEPLVARLYDPLYYDDLATDRFASIERSVAIHCEAYKHLQSLVGSHVPALRGIFVVEITHVDFRKPRYIYCVLSDYVPGTDMRRLINEYDRDGEKTCDAHRAALLDCAARLLYDFFPLTIYPHDMFPRNLVMDIPDTPSLENFCDVESCPWRNKIHIDLEFSRSQPEHRYAPKAKMIDLELLRFMEPRAYMHDISYCRRWLVRLWNEAWISTGCRDILGTRRWQPELTDERSNDW